MRKLLAAALFVVLGSGLTIGLPQGQAGQEGLLMAAKPTSLYDFTMDDIDGKPVNLGQYRGKVLLVVNTASFCGNTPQYTDLETIYEQYRDKGLEVLAFPANNFGAQEPGTDAEIKEFCTVNYGVTFPMFSKISVTRIATQPAIEMICQDSGSAIATVPTSTLP